MADAAAHYHRASPAPAEAAHPNALDPLARVVRHAAKGSREGACALACAVAGDLCRNIVERDLSISCAACEPTGAYRGGG